MRLFLNFLNCDWAVFLSFDLWILIKTSIISGHSVVSLYNFNFNFMRATLAISVAYGHRSKYRIGTIVRYHNVCRKQKKTTTIVIIMKGISSKTAKSKQCEKNNLYSCSCVRNEVAMACTLLHLIFRFFPTHFSPSTMWSIANKLQNETREGVGEIRRNIRLTACMHACVCVSEWVVDGERWKWETRKGPSVLQWDCLNRGLKNRLSNFFRQL